MISEHQIMRHGEFDQPKRTLFTSRAVWCLWVAHFEKFGVSPRGARDFTLLMQLCVEGETEALTMMMYLIQYTQLPATQDALKTLEAMVVDRERDPRD